MVAERQPIQTVIVANNREYFSPIDPFVPESEKNEFVEADFDEADMDMMWLGDNKLVLTPRKLDPDFVSDIVKLFGYENLRFLIPFETESGVSKDVVSDNQALLELVDEISEGINPRIIPWGHTTQFQNLLDNLSKNGVSFRTPETPRPEGLWIPDYIDTKVGSRKFLEEVKTNHPELAVAIPEGFICENLAEALGKIDYFIAQNKGVVFKANLGGSGIGIQIFSYDELAKPEQRKQIEEKLKDNALFTSDKVVIEEKIPADFTQHGVDPSVDSLIKEDGSVELQSIDAMVIHHQGQEVGFYGCIGGKGLFNDNQAKALRDFTYAVGQDLSSLGYRGWYDTDYVLTPEGTFYTTEVNLRRTSMSYVIDIAKLLIGSNWESEIAVRSNDKYIRKSLEGLNYLQVKDMLSDLMYPVKNDKRGVIITQSVRTKFGRGKFGYLIIGKDHNDTKEIEEQIESIFP